MESGDSARDDRCAWVTVAAQPGAPVTANITFNRYAGAPTFITAPAISSPTDITPDGSIVVGGLGGPVFRWDLNADTFENIGGLGSRIDLRRRHEDRLESPGHGRNREGRDLRKRRLDRDPAGSGIDPVRPGRKHDSQLCAWTSPGTARPWSGQSYGDGCFRGGIRAFKWTAAGGSVALPKFSSFNNMSRANAVNYDGSVIVGLDETTSGQWRGAFWKNGVVKLITRLGQNVESALDVSRDGQYIVGESSLGVVEQRLALLGRRQHRRAARVVPELRQCGHQRDQRRPRRHHRLQHQHVRREALAPTIWTPGLHWSNFNTFLIAQGVNLTDIYPYAPTAMSADGRVITGVLASIFGDVGFVVKTPTSIVCHAPAGSPTQLQTTIVSFPQGLDAALASGDTLGPCQCNAAAPTGIPALTVGKPAAGTAQLEWSAVAAATGYDLARGSLAVLRSSHGDFSAATTDCLENDLTGTSRDDADTPDAGDGFWYLVRAVNCGGSATFDSGAPSQVGSRDAGIQASPSTCP